MATATAPVPRETLFTAEDFVQPTMPLELLQIGPNVRTDPGELEELAASIREFGVLQPVKVQSTPAGWVVLWGQRRVLASRLAGLTEIPVIVAPPADEDATGLKLEQLVENLQRADLNPIEEAIALRAILDTTEGLTQDALADKLGRSRPWVSNSVGLLEAAPAVQELVRTNVLTGAHAKALRGLTIEDQAELGKRAADGNWSSSETERQAKWAKEGEKETARKRERSKKTAAEAIADLEKVANRETSTIAVSDFYGGSVAALVEADGWKVTTAACSTIAEAGSCGCAGVWRVEVPYNAESKVKVAPGCVSPEHNDERRKAQNAEWEKRSAEAAATRAAEAAANVTRGAHLAALLVDAWTDPFALRLATYALFSDDTDDELVATLGLEPEAAADLDDAMWVALEALPDDKIVPFFARAIAEAITDGWHVSKDVLAAVDARLAPAPLEAEAKPTKARKAGRQTSSEALAEEETLVGTAGVVSDPDQPVADLLPFVPAYEPRAKQSTTFRVSWAVTLQDLGDEIEKMGGTDVLIGIVAGEDQFTLDGRLKPTVKVAHPGAEVSFDVGDRRLTFHTDAFNVLQFNLRAIGLGLEALRTVDRYGITSSGEQYAGFLQLAAGGPDPVRGKALVDAAGGLTAALKKHHPDHGGETRDFVDVQAFKKTWAGSR